MYQQFRNLGTFHTKTTSHVLGARSHAWKSIESSVQSLFDFSYTCTLVSSVNRPIAFLPVISRCRRRSRCFITTAISSLMFGSMATTTKKPLNLKLPVSLRSRKHFAMKESMQQLIVQFIGNRKITTRWNATKVSRKCITGTAQVVGHFFGWFNFFFFFFTLVTQVCHLTHKQGLVIWKYWTLTNRMDKLCLVAVANEFAALNDNRKDNFGTFKESDLKMTWWHSTVACVPM